MTLSDDNAVPPIRGSLAATIDRLHKERADLRARILQSREDMAVLFEASRDSNADDEHDPEGQTIAFERAQLSALLEQSQEHLKEVDAALERAVGGTYGICEVCHQAINVARLEARPSSRTCVEHAQNPGRATR